MPKRSAAWAAILALAAAGLLAAAPREAEAFPDAEVVWSSSEYAEYGPPFDFNITSFPSGFLLLSDRRLAVSYRDVLRLVDMGAFELEPLQPPPLSEEKMNDGIIGGIAYIGSSNRIVASQEDGDMLEFVLADITSDPLSTELMPESKLAAVTYDDRAGLAYVADNSDQRVYAYNVVSGDRVSTITPVVPGQSSFRITDMLYVDETREIYFTTDVGALFYIASGGASATMIPVATAAGDELSALDALPGGGEIYTTNYDKSLVHRVSTSTHSVLGSAIELSPNSSPSDIRITRVTNPTAIYAYVAGAKGVSVINTATHTVLDMGDDPGVDGEPIPTSAEPYLLEASTEADGNVYMFFATGGVGLITENPVAAVLDVEYSGGASFLGQGGSVEITFVTDADGIYEFRSGGDIYGSGSLLEDASGSTSGSVEAGEEATVKINYDDNAALFDEGENDVWFFVQSGSLRGRRAASVFVDTPPPDVVLRSTGFGTQKLYVNFDRVDVSDMASYNVYVDTDPDAVLTKADAAVSVQQPSGGSSVTAEAGGLANGTLYYIAVEAVDANGNKSDNRSASLPDGARASAMPERTVGPAGVGDCSLAKRQNSRAPLAAALAAPLLAIFALFRSRRSAVAAALLFACAVLLAPSESAAQTRIEERPATPGFSRLEERLPNWHLELKTGFWMPQSSALERYFGNCCNLITRLQGGYMFQRRYAVEFGVGLLYKSGMARGETSDLVSQDRFKFIMVPMDLSFVWRADYFNWRYIIPYMKAGFDIVPYYESVAGASVSGMKWGMHTAGGAMLNLTEIAARWGDRDVVAREFFMTFEAEYMYVDSFGSGTLDLSGPVFSIGLLFYF